MAEATDKNRAINSDYWDKTLQIKAIFVAAWRLTSGLKWPVLKRVLWVFLSVTILLWLQLIITAYIQRHFSWPYFSYQTLNVVIKIMVSILVMKLWVPVLMIGVRKAIGLPVDLKLIKFECANVKYSLLNLIIIYALIVNVFSFVLEFLPSYGLYWAGGRVMWYVIVSALLIPINFFAFPLLVIQKLTVYSALKSAYKKALTNWIVVAGSCITLSILIWSLIGVLLWLGLYYRAVTVYLLPPVLLILLFWLIPMLSTLGGVLFRELYGLKKREEAVNG